MLAAVEAYESSDPNIQAQPLAAGNSPSDLSPAYLLQPTNHPETQITVWILHVYCHSFHLMSVLTIHHFFLLCFHYNSAVVEKETYLWLFPLNKLSLTVSVCVYIPACVCNHHLVFLSIPSLEQSEKWQSSVLTLFYSDNFAFCLF